MTTSSSITRSKRQRPSQAKRKLISQNMTLGILSLSMLIMSSKSMVTAFSVMGPLDRTTRSRYLPKVERIHQARKTVGILPLLSSNGDGDRMKDGKQRKPSAKRIGGRSRRKPNDDRLSQQKMKWPTSGGFWITALLILTLLKNLLFGGTAGDSGYYYYSYSSSSSSVYETVINPDGSRNVIETSRKESSDLKSNIPGLTSEKVYLEQQGRESRPETLFFDLYGQDQDWR